MTNQAPFQFGVSEFTTWPWSFEQDVETYARLGVETIEVCEFKLADQPARIPERVALIGQHGLTASSVQPATRTLFPSQSQPEPIDVPARMARFRQAIETFAPLLPGAPFVTNTGIAPNGNIQRLLDVAVTEYRAAADFAREHGARVAFEPLNPTIMNVESAIWTLDQAMDLVAAVDRDNFGICFDTWNIWQNAGIVESIRACGDRIFVVQLSDWRTPRSFQDRLVIGQGAIPLPPLLRAIHESGFRGAYALEIFSGDVPDALWKADLSKVIEDSRAGLEAAWQQAFAV